MNCDTATPPPHPTRRVHITHSFPLKRGSVLYFKHKSVARQFCYICLSTPNQQPAPVLSWLKNASHLSTCQLPLVVWGPLSCISWSSSFLLREIYKVGDKVNRWNNTTHVASQGLCVCCLFADILWCLQSPKIFLVCWETWSMDSVIFK